MKQVNQQMFQQQPANEKQKQQAGSSLSKKIKSLEMKMVYLKQKRDEVKILNPKILKLNQRCRQIIKVVRKVLPIIGQQNIEFIQENGKQRIPVVEDRISNELKKIKEKYSSNYCFLNKLRREDKSEIIPNKDDGKNQSIKREKGLKNQVQGTSQVKEGFLVENKQSHELPRKNLLQEEQNQYLEYVISFLQKVKSKWENYSLFQTSLIPQKQLDKREMNESELSNTYENADEKLTLSRENNPHLSEQENEKIKMLKLQLSKLTSQTKILRLQYLYLLDKAEDILPFIIEDQKYKSKHERIEVKTQSVRLVHYVTLPFSSKDIVNESNRIRSLIHKQLKKNIKASLSPNSQFEKDRISIENKIKITQFRKEYLHSIIQKMRSYLQNDSYQKIPEQSQAEQINSNWMFLEDPFNNMTLEDKGNVMKDQKDEANNDGEIVLPIQNEKKRLTQLSSLLKTALMQKQTLKSQYFNMLNRGQSSGPPFLSNKDLCIYLKGSKNENINEIYTSQRYLDYNIRRLLSNYNSDKRFKEQKIIKKLQNQSLPSDKILERPKQTKQNSLNFQIYKIHQINKFLRRSITALEEYLSKWEQMKKQQFYLLKIEHEQTLIKIETTK